MRKLLMLGTMTVVATMVLSKFSNYPVLSNNKAAFSDITTSTLSTEDVIESTTEPSKEESNIVNEGNEESIYEFYDGKYNCQYGDFNLSVSENILNGITLKDNDNVISIKPNNTSYSSKGLVENDSIVFTNKNSNNNYLIYTPMNDGVKQKIVLSSEAELKSLKFNIDTDNIYLIKQENELLFFDSKNSDLIATISNIDICDSNGISINEMINIDTQENIKSHVAEIGFTNSITNNNSLSYPISITLSVSLQNNIDDVSTVPNYNSINILSNDFENAAILPLNTTISTHINQNTKNYYKFIPNNTGFYTFESSSIISGDPYALLYNSNADLLKYDDDSVGEQDTNFRLTYHLISGTTYYFAAGCFAPTSGNYSFSVFNTSSSSYITANNLNSLEPFNITTNSSYESTVYKFVPAVTGEHLFFSSQPTGDPKIWIYDSSLTLINQNDDGAGNLNFRYANSFTIGTTYYIVFGHYYAYSGSYDVNHLISSNLTDSTYYIKNIGSSIYMDIHGPSEQEFVHQWTFQPGTQSHWEIITYGNDTYLIKSKYGRQKYMGIDSYNTFERNIKLFTNVDDNVLWKIYKNDSLQYIEPLLTPGKILYACNGNTGEELQLSYIDSIDEKCNWKFLNKNRDNINLEISYDGGYNERHNNASDRISNNIIKLQEKYLNEFEIWINCNSPYQFESYADSCQSVYYAPCTEAGDEVCYNSTSTDLELFHHKNIYNIIHRISPRIQNSSAIMAFIGHVTCEVIRDPNGNFIDHDDSQPYGVAFSGLNLITITNFKEDDENGENETKTIVHEVGHLFGAPDHYSNNGIGTSTLNEPIGSNVFNNDCIYGENKEIDNIVRGLIICEGCKSRIENNRSRFSN